MPATVKLGSVSLDCPGPQALAAFYAGLLDVDVAYDSEQFAATKLDGIWLSTQRVEEYCPPRWPDSAAPQQLHLDFSVQDLDAGEAHALELGATKATVQPGPDRYRVLLDPAGHPFCLTTQIPE